MDPGERGEDGSEQDVDALTAEPRLDTPPDARHSRSVEHGPQRAVQAKGGSVDSGEDETEDGTLDGQLAVVRVLMSTHRSGVENDERSDETVADDDAEESLPEVRGGS